MKISIKRFIFDINPEASYITIESSSISINRSPSEDSSDSSSIQNLIEAENLIPQNYLLQKYWFAAIMGAGEAVLGPRTDVFVFEQ